MSSEKRTIQRSWEFEADSAKAQHFVFPDEEIGSNASYPIGRKPHPLTEQARHLTTFFPTLQNAPFREKMMPADGLDGIIVVPNYLKLGLTYNEATEIALRHLAKSRTDFINCREGELGIDYLRPLTKTQQALETLGSNNSDFILIPAQLGQKHLGKSARQAHMDLTEIEFGLGPFEVAIFLLTHPEWLSTETDLGIDCVGCEYGPYRHGFYKYILFFYFKKFLKFEERWCGCPDACFGPATGFLS